MAKASDVVVGEFAGYTLFVPGDFWDSLPDAAKIEYVEDVNSEIEYLTRELENKLERWVAADGGHIEG